MDDFLAQLSRQINDVTQKILSPDQQEKLKQDMHSASSEFQHSVHSAAQDFKSAMHDIGSGFDPVKNVPPPTGQSGWNNFQKNNAGTKSQRTKTVNISSNQTKPGFQTLNKAAPAAAPKTAGWILLIILGVFLINSGFAGFAESIKYFSFSNPLGSIFEIGLSLLPMGLGGLSIGVGVKRISYIKRFRKYREQLRGIDYATIENMSRAFALPEETIRRDLKRMMKDRYFTDCYMDDDETCFILNRKMYEYYLTQKANLEQKKLEAERAAVQSAKEELKEEETSEAEEFRRTGETYIRRIRQINIDLPEPVISEKLDKLEQVCSRIFDHVSTHPEKMPQIRKFMSYYLPTTLKLSEAYRELELRSIETEDVRTTKQEIRTALDNINLAFHKLYDNLLQKDLMGLSADISALESILTQEGLMDDELHV